MCRAKHACKRPRPHHVEDLVVAVEVTSPLVGTEQFDLIVRQDSPTNACLKEIVRWNVPAAKVGPNVLELTIGYKLQFERLIGNSLSFGFGHAISLLPPASGQKRGTLNSVKEGAQWTLAPTKMGKRISNWLGRCLSRFLSYSGGGLLAIHKITSVCP